MKGVLVVAGSDSSGGAGLAADLRTLLSCGVHGLCAMTCVTAQTGGEVGGVWPVPVEAVRAQLSTALDVIGVDAVKTGVLGSAAAAAAVVDALSGRTCPVVVDPVQVASSGGPLTDADTTAVLRDALLPLATVATPNLAEVQALTGVVVWEEDGLRRAADAMLEIGPRWVLVTGGHLPGEAVDLLSDGSTELYLRGPRLAAPHQRGTGCTLSSALAAYLALGEDVPTAARKAKSYVTGAIAGGFPVGPGPGVLDHAWRTR